MCMLDPTRMYPPHPQLHDCPSDYLHLSVACHSLAYLFVFSQQLLKVQLCFPSMVSKEIIVLKLNSCEDVSS